MKTTQLQKLKESLELGRNVDGLNQSELLEELDAVLSKCTGEEFGILGESLAAPSSSLRCPNCGHKIY